MELSKIEETWGQRLSHEFSKPYFRSLSTFINKEYATREIYPKQDEIFRAFALCPFEKVKVVIIGQDPYHNPTQAHGLSFSVNEKLSLPPSLKNIYKELNADLGIPISKNGDLTRWASQGVLLLNSILTVRSGFANSHKAKGWEEFTSEAVRVLAMEKKNIVYILWGTYAQQKCSFISSESNLVLKSVHPSPLSAYRGFFGSHPFSQANDYLTFHHKQPIIW